MNVMDDPDVGEHQSILLNKEFDRNKQAFPVAPVYDLHLMESQCEETDKVKNGKAADSPGITAEMLKASFNV